MSTPHIADAPPLNTDDDVLGRVEHLIGPAAGDRKLWVMWVDGDGRQAPVVMPVDDVPHRPDRGMLNGLAGVLGGLHDELRTAAGAGSVILTLERFGTDEVLDHDRTWVEALEAACARAEMRLRGVFLSTPGGVRRL